MSRTQHRRRVALVTLSAFLALVITFSELGNPLDLGSPALRPLVAGIPVELNTRPFRRTAFVMPKVTTSKPDAHQKNLPPLKKRC